jgi:ABC-type Zn uptake system ZnuABC Zn-binding protein ZnuA
LHNGYGYFENYFNVEPIISIANDHEDDIKISELNHFYQLAKEGKIKCVFQDGFSHKNSAIKIAKNANLKLVQLNIWQDENAQKLSYHDTLKKLANLIIDCK